MSDDIKTGQQLTIRGIQRLIAEHYSQAFDDFMMGRSHTYLSFLQADQISPRQIAMWLCKVNMLGGCQDIAAAFDNCDAATVFYVIKRVNTHVETNLVLAKDAAYLCAHIDNAYGRHDVPHDPALAVNFRRLEFNEADEQRPLSIGLIQKETAYHYGLVQADLLSKKRTRRIARPRQIAMWLCKQYTTRSYPNIGRRFGGRDHTTVLHAVKKINELMTEDVEFARKVRVLERKLGITRPVMPGVSPAAPAGQPQPVG